MPRHNHLVNYAKLLASRYGIRLSDEDADRLDRHFTGACHHFYRWQEALARFPAQIEFHRIRYGAHLRHLMSLVSERGDFSEANDPTHQGLDEPETWCPDTSLNPDPSMFYGLGPDDRFGWGFPHTLDGHLKSLESPHPKSTPKPIRTGLRGTG